MIQQKDQRLVPLVCNETQIRIIQAIFEQEDAGKPVRILELKGRQQGSSTGISGYCFLRAIVRARTRALVITEEKGGSAGNVFSMYEIMQEHFPLELPMVQSRRGAVMHFGESLQSIIKVEGEKSITSLTLQLVHLSEAAFFSDLNGTMNMLYQTVPELPGTAIFLETTANLAGDAFHREWTRAKEGRSDFMALFIPWFAHSEYRLPVEDPLEFENSLGSAEDDTYGDEVTLLENHSELTPEHLAWRRNAIRNKCGGNILEFHRQYPSDDEEAFVATGRTFIDMGAIQWYRKNFVKEPKHRGFLEDTPSGPKFVEDVRGVLLVWEPPEPYAEYIIGSDQAEGLDTGAHNCAIVASRLPFAQVARLRGYDGRRLGINEFAEQLWLLGLWYTEAWINPENNKDGGTVVSKLTSEYHYRRLVSEATLLGRPSPRFGWTNTQRSRRRGLSLIEGLFQYREYVIPDALVLDECATLVSKDSRIEAMYKTLDRRPGDAEYGFYDDAVFATIGVLLYDEAAPVAASPDRLRARERSAMERIKRERQNKRRGYHQFQ